MAKKKFPEIAYGVAQAVNLEGNPYAVPWSHQYRVIEPAPGTKLIVVQEDDEVIREVPLDHLTDKVASWMRLHGVPEWIMTIKQAREAADLWRGIATPIEPGMIKAVRWKGEHGLAWNRIPWEMRWSEAPTWDRLLERMSNAKAFREWVGSLFFEESSLHSYVWLHGVGGDGKGSICRFLAKVFGRAFRSRHPPSTRHHDKFWTYGLMNARLVVFPDCNDHAFVSGGLFKSLTGGDPIEVEAKGRMPFTTKLNAKFMVISQEKPSISSERADMRRIIYCELEKTDEFDPEFEKRLWAEGGGFLYSCIKAYADGYPQHAPIRADMEQITEWVSEVEEPFEEFFFKHFKIATTGQVSPSQMQDALERQWPGKRQQQLDFRRWLERTHSIKKSRPRLASTDSGRLYAYRGLAMRTSDSKAPKKGFYDD